MQIKEFIDCVCSQIKYKQIRGNIAEEIQSHIEESKQSYIQEGFEEKIAEEKAISNMGEAQEIGKRLNKIHSPRLNWKLLLIICILISFGFLVLLIRTKRGVQSSLSKYILFILVGFILGVIVYFTDYKKLSKYSDVLYLIATGIIIYALLFGTQINGIPYIYVTGSIIFAPAVVAIPLYIIAFAGFIDDLNKENKFGVIISKYINVKINMNFLKIIILSIISLGILMLIPSKSSALILGLVYLILGTVKILQLKQNRFRNLVKLWGTVIAIGICLVVFTVGISPYCWDRISVSFNPEIDPEGWGWLATNRRTIIESAKMFGEAENTSHAIDVFDEGTNFAFISILAHYGWIVSIGIVLSIIALSTKLIFDAIKTKDNYGKLILIGISSMFILQSIFNILMNLNLWIEADFNLPFISYGGTNLIINIVSLALNLTVYRNKDIITTRNKKNFVYEK